MQLLVSFVRYETLWLFVTPITMCIHKVDLCFVTPCSLSTLVSTYKDLRGERPMQKRDTSKRLSKLPVHSFSHITCSPAQSLFHHSNNHWISQWHLFQFLNFAVSLHRITTPSPLGSVDTAVAIWRNKLSCIAGEAHKHCVCVCRTAVVPSKHLHLCCQWTPCCRVY